MNNDSFLIEDSDLEQVKEICRYIPDSDLRNRSAANILAATISKRYFQDLDVDIDSGLHNISSVLEKYDVSDIYINDAYIDVRLYVDENKILIPKEHFECSALPVAYMLIKLDDSFSNGLVSGFILPENINQSKSDDRHYIISEDDLVSFYDIESHLIAENVGLPEDIELQAYNYLDNCHENVAGFLKLLLCNEDARGILKEIVTAQNVYKYVTIPQIYEETQADTVKDLIEETDVVEKNSVNDAADGLIITASDEDIMMESSDEYSVDLLEQDGTDFELEESSVVIDEIADVDAEEQEFLLEGQDDLLQEQDINNTSESVLEETENLAGDVLEDTIINETSDIEVEYPTSITPSLNTIESGTQEHSLEVDEFDEIIEKENKLLDEDLEQKLSQELGDEIIQVEYTVNNESVTPNLEIERDEESESQDSKLSNSTLLEKDLEDSYNHADNITANSIKEDVSLEEQGDGIDTLFNPESFEEDSEEFENSCKPKSRPILPMLLGLVFIAAVGYWGVSSFVLKDSKKPSSVAVNKTIKNNNNLTVNKTTTAPQNLAMPDESVENVANTGASNEGISTPLVVIEKNLDASIDVTNLSVSWEVPSSYINNSIAKRYFTKIGKIVQLNLKSELLLLVSQPLTDKITVELEYSDSLENFVFKKILTSSGDAAVDKVIEQTVQNALRVKSNTNLSVFKNIQGKPILVIKL